MVYSQFKVKLLKKTNFSNSRIPNPNIIIETPSPIVKTENALYFKYAFIANFGSAWKPLILLFSIRSTFIIHLYVTKLS